LTVLLRRTIRDRLRRSRPEKILNVFHRIGLRFFRACGLAFGRTSVASSRTAMSDRLPEDAEKVSVLTRPTPVRQDAPFTKRRSRFAQKPNVSKRTPSPLRLLRPCPRNGASLGEEAVSADSGRAGEVAAGVGRVRSLAFLSILLGVFLLS